MQSPFLTQLDQAREWAGVAFHINSGFRCAHHNRAVGGKPGSSHTLGLAVDLKAIESGSRFHMIRGLLQAGFKRIGVDVKRGFLHVDADASKPQQVMWGY
ncbi:D-Ala-D-Ala carboxypeptidase family metallohydrolase [Magnetococcus marinus]|nr:D-Ala-D-Ala carboxypeptidase family metallohydrolase [Magnetococcus marinus]